jgi:pimeloyl-ACP methyl ester carboxylesterase
VVRPFAIQIDDEVLGDLESRLQRSQFTGRSGGGPWEAGTDPDYLRDLAGYWHSEFDWRAQEAQLNALPHFTAEIDGTRLHFVHLAPERAESAAPQALILSHGWPSSFVEMLPLAHRLAYPERHGGDPGRAFDVVVPSLPGFLFSALPETPLTRFRIADTLHRLMVDVLGYERYGAFGGDIGGVATTWLGALFAGNVTGIHTIHPPFPSSFEDPLTPAEKAFLEAEETYDATDGGYSAIMASRPDTIAAALVDSPVGLAAWIIDKYRDWSDCHGDLESRFDRDTLLTIITLYWATRSIGSSFRSYFDHQHNTARPTITVPAAVTLSSEPVMASFPREIAERACTDIRHWSEPGRGGHFMAHEEPDLLADEVREFFGSIGM